MQPTSSPGEESELVPTAPPVAATELEIDNPSLLCLTHQLKRGHGLTIVATHIEGEVSDDASIIKREKAAESMLDIIASGVTAGVKVMMIHTDPCCRFLK